ncbi:MAG: histidinol-phosphate transaminase [Christensenellaceae bacterium]
MFLSRLAQNITPYTAGEQRNDRKYVKLNTNENPYPPSDAVRAVLNSFDEGRLRLYPDPAARGLREAIAEAEGVSVENVFCGNGSDEVLALCFPAFFDPEGKGACYADITYSFYPVFSKFFHIPEVIVPVREDFSFDMDGLLGADCQGYFIANPNAPTSVGMPLDRIEAFVRAAADRIVILDEAYMDFYGESAVPLTKRYPNVLVVKTFSKSYSLAGLRCGYAVGNAELVDALFRMKDCFNSYPVDMLCQAVCTAAVRDRVYHRECIEKVVSERERVKTALRDMGLTVLDSASNFLFVSFERIGGERAYLALRERGVLVRHWNTERIRDYCRITVGSPEQNEALLSAVREILC